jgi:lactoylglutathione lyase
MYKISPLEIKVFDHMQMDVADLEESIEFYDRVFGFKIVEIGLRVSTRWAIVGNRYNLYLCMHEYRAGKNIENAGLEITHFGLIVDDFENCMSKLKEFNVKLVYKEPVEYHSSRSVYFLDPNNYKIEISEKPGGGLINPYHSAT